jgi:hypothetical protein
VSPRRRLFFTGVSASLGVWLLDAWVARTTIPGIDTLLQYLPFAIALTVFAVTGVANAINIIDGFNGLASLCSSTPLPQQMMSWDMDSYLPDDILVKVDRAAMASSLETRVPFLDHRVVEFAMATPLHFKIRNGCSKWLLRELLAKVLPRPLFDKPKQSFSLPLDAWLRGPLRDWAEALLDVRKLRNSGLLDVDAVRRTWAEQLQGRRNHQRAIWTILMFQAWLEQEAAGTSSRIAA